MKVITIGRSADSGMVVNDSKVSRVHAQLVQDDNGNISIVDLGSANGTYVNGNRISDETRLKSGDEVRIGDTCLPWQGYFQEKRKSNTGVKEERTCRGMKKTSMPLFGGKRVWLYVAGGVSIVLLLIGGYIILHGKQKTEEIQTELEQTMNERSQLELETKFKDAEHEAKMADVTYENAVRSAKSKKELDSLERVLAAKKKAVEQAEKEMKVIEQVAENAKNAASAATAEKKLAEEKAKEESEKAELAKNEVKKAQEEKAQAEKKQEVADMKNEFYKQLNKARTEKRLKTVCKKLNIPVKNGFAGIGADSDNDLYTLIEEKYNGEESLEKRKEIISEIEKAK